MTQLPRPALCQVNYDRDLPASTRLQVSNNHHQQQLTRPRHSPIPCITCKQRGEQPGKTPHDKRTPYRYSLPPPKSASHPPDSDFISFLSRRERPIDHHARARTAGTAYSLPVLPSRVGLQTSLTMNAERLKEPTWNHCLNAWVSSTRCHQAYVSIAGPSNLNNRDIFHFVREFDEIRRSPCERFEGHMHHHQAPKQIQKRSKKILEKPEFWHWRGRTEPVIRRFTKVKRCLPDSNSSSSKSCMCAFSTRGRISITLPVPSPSSSPESYADSCRSDTCVPDFSPHSFLSELSSLSPFSSTFNPVSPSESRVSANSLTTTTSGIVSCDSFPSTTVPKTTPVGLSYPPAASRFPSVVPWEGEDGWGSDISSFHVQPTIIALPADKTIHYCKFIVETPFFLEQLTIFTGTHTWKSFSESKTKPDKKITNGDELTSSSISINNGQTAQSVPTNNALSHLVNNVDPISHSVKQTVVPPNSFVSSDMVKIEDVDRVDIRMAPSLHRLPDLPPAPPILSPMPPILSPTPPPKAMSPEVKLKENESPMMSPIGTRQPRKKREKRQKEKPIKKTANIIEEKPKTPLPRIPTPVELSPVTEPDETVTHTETPVSTTVTLPPLPKLQFNIEQKPPSPTLINQATTMIPAVYSPSPPLKSVTPSPSPESEKHEPLTTPDIDPAIRLELERQRRADERRRKALLMYEKLKKRKGVTQGTSPDSLSIIDSGWLAQFCIIKREKEYLYRRAFETADEDCDGFLTCQEMLIALKGVASVNSLSDAEEEYVYQVLELAGYSVLNGADFKLFSVVASLTQKISSIDNWMKNFIMRMDFKMLDMKMFRAKELFLWNVDESTNQLSLDRLMIELKAGGVSQEHQNEVQTKLGHLEALDILDFLTYLPLFLLMHSSVISNPFNTVRDK